MKVQVGTKIKALRDIPSGDGDVLKAGAVISISELGFFGVGSHLAADALGNPWVIDEDMIDSTNPDLNEFTIL